MNFKNMIPDDSVLHLWMNILATTEVPKSYQVVTGLSTIGCLARRSRYIDQVNWKVYPALRIILVGPSGIGKDTAIDQSVDMIQQCSNIPIIGGKTYESIASELANLPPPAVALIPAPELTAFLGRSSYQESMVQRFTDLLSDKNKLDISTRKDGTLFIQEPTVTLQGGSTVEWLQRAMPDGSLEGGFFPRFLIIPEEYTGRHVPLVKHSLEAHEIQAVKDNKAVFTDWCKDFNRSMLKKRREVRIGLDAVDIYSNWYYNRRKYFADSVRAYAERSRDQVLRLAMLMTLSRGRNYVDANDMHFGIELISLVADRIANVVIPPSYEGRCAASILKLLPSTLPHILQELAGRHTRRVVMDALKTLEASNQIEEIDGTLRIRSRNTTSKS